tara:strand:+ start:1051 stop:1260 length:210 start_codon:yes stop_codon:yes gene_type:complete
MFQKEFQWSGVDRFWFLKDERFRKYHLLGIEFLVVQSEGDSFLQSNQKSKIRMEKNKRLEKTEKKQKSS